MSHQRSFQRSLCIIWVAFNIPLHQLIIIHSCQMTSRASNLSSRRSTTEIYYKYFKCLPYINSMLWPDDENLLHILPILFLTSTYCQSWFPFSNPSFQLLHALQLIDPRDLYLSSLRVPSNRCCRYLRKLAASSPEMCYMYHRKPIESCQIGHGND